MKLISILRNITAGTLAGFALISFAVISPANGQAPKDPPDRLLPPVEGLVAVVYPDLEGVEPKVAKQIESVRDLLIQNTKVDKTTSRKLGDAYGTNGMVYHTYSMFEPAVQCYTNAAILMPTDFRWRHLLGLIRVEQNDPKAAVEEFDKAAKLNPSFVPALVKAGDAYFALDLFGLARNSYEAALQKNANEPAALFGLGQIKYQEKDYKSAAGYFSRVLSLVPDANRVHYSLALAYRGLNESEKAKSEISKQGPVGITVADSLLTEILSLRQGSILKLQQGKLAYDAGRPEEAVIFYKEILEDEPENLTALVNIGASYTLLKKYQEATAALESAIKIDPNNLNAVYNLGVLYSLENKPLKAIERLKTLLEARPQDYEARYVLAKELRKAGLLEESLAEYRMVVEQNPQNEKALIDLVGMLNERGMHQEIMKRLNDAYSQFPTRAWTVASYTFALAASPDKSLRNGELALELSQKIYKVTGQTEHGFLVVLALGELGRCDNALELGNQFIEKAKVEKQEKLVATLTAEVERLSKPGGCGKPGN